MKLNLSRRSSARTGRSQLGQRAFGALSNSLGALPGRGWLAGLAGTGPAAEANSERLRDVLSRDRALSALRQAERAASPALPEPGQPASTGAVAALPQLASTLAESTTALEAGSAQPGAVSTPAQAGSAPAEAAMACAEVSSLPPLAPAAAPALPEAASMRLEAAAAPLSASEERPQVVQHEPIRTRTMARLLAAQGYRARALAIYDELLARSPEDAALRAELEALRTRSA